VVLLLLIVWGRLLLLLCWLLLVLLHLRHALHSHLKALQPIKGCQQPAAN
jgi:hypothetical protein